ncbi:uncharacterized protein B0H18DRAFT_1082234 [Fomitopsis serialis]|uniref:uncharacterized protein n=1 Tax=Fomitopsis serialis TaxID=139415 RepID=UPI0020080F05|nr:uncharacterized protein B0H18DRAFT_1082234 [Neoantrodia serialis]KAH9935458.1 hypothetical protein B0H18DRAFT_1082234 [Neoantrodia serialis]
MPDVPMAEYIQFTSTPVKRAERGSLSICRTAFHSKGDGGTAPENYRKHQDSHIPIVDGRCGTGSPPLAPPVEIYHRAFASFMCHARDEDRQPSGDIIRKTAELMDTASEIAFWTSSTKRTTAGHCIGVPIGFLGLAVMAIIEEKGEFGSSGEGSVQGSFSYIEHWVDQSQEKLRKMSCCPTFIISIAGPWIVICGAIFTSDIIVQRLTDYIWLGRSRTIDDDRVVRIARVFDALACAIESLKSFYINLELFENENKRRRYFPLATSYVDNGRTVTFRYLKPLGRTDSSCVTFLAQREGHGAQVVVMFVERYGAAAHELLASRGWAPKLLYYGPVWPGADGLPDPDCHPRRMVVMEYVQGRSKPYIPDGAREVVRQAIALLHEHDMVHGDIRPPNILIEGDGDDGWGLRTKIIDFDWAGEAGKVHYPLNLSKGIRWPPNVVDYGLIDAAHDDEMVTQL